MSSTYKAVSSFDKLLGLLAFIADLSASVELVLDNANQVIDHLDAGSCLERHRAMILLAVFTQLAIPLSSSLTLRLPPATLPTWSHSSEPVQDRAFQLTMRSSQLAQGAKGRIIVLGTAFVLGSQSRVGRMLGLYILQHGNRAIKGLAYFADTPVQLCEYGFTCACQGNQGFEYFA